MRLSKLKVENFRTLEDVEVCFPHYYSAICGKNDSGKTNIVRAVRGIMNEHDPFGFVEEDEISLKTDFTKWKQVEQENREITIAMSLSANKNSDAGLFEFLIHYLPLEDTDEDLQFCVELVIDSKETSGRVIVHVGDKEFDGLKAQEVLKKIQTSRMILFHNSTEPDPRLRYGRKFREISEQHSEDIENLNKAIKNSLNKIAKGQQDQLSELIGRLDSKYKVSLTLPEFNFSYLPFEIALSDSKIDVSLDNWGSGTKNRTLILLTLFKARQISESTISASKITPIIIIEEPESFLHPSAQAEFSRVLQDLAEELQVQVITTTHSPYMLSKDSPNANVLLQRHLIYKQQRETITVDTAGQNWMEPFGLALGLDNSEFGSWHDLFFSKSHQIILVEGQTDKEYLELLRNESHGKNMLILDGEIYPYDGIGNIQNGVLLNFLKNKYKKIVVTFDLDVEGGIKKILDSLGFEKGKNYFPIGLDEAGRRNIEGLVPATLKREVHANNVALIEQAMNGTSGEKSEAKNQLKRITLDEFKKTAVPNKDYFKHFYELSKVLNKALNT